ncbi:hypothetical protein E2C01_067930 [Portunus trituberculatus]|uniref:Uncharacterized protein n=1 Tax=Portunus trituberculatus TaxID=210409 RepID=A0A5B7HUY8_PORTR|nr:hypothetical protein [Portunus trituberculatus]
MNDRHYFYERLCWRMRSEHRLLQGKMTLEKRRGEGEARDTARFVAKKQQELRQWTPDEACPGGTGGKNTVGVVSYGQVTRRNGCCDKLKIQRDITGNLILS